MKVISADIFRVIREIVKSVGFEKSNLNELHHLIEVKNLRFD